MILKKTKQILKQYIRFLISVEVERKEAKNERAYPQYRPKRD